jgi:hypothetical protein
MKTRNMTEFAEAIADPARRQGFIGSIQLSEFLSEERFEVETGLTDTGQVEVYRAEPKPVQTPQLPFWEIQRLHEEMPFGEERIVRGVRVGIQKAKT